jgi:hypothetical protein
MKRILPLLATILLANAAFADGPETANQLEALGGKVVLKDGAISQITFTDCEKLGEAELRAIGGCAKLKSLTLYGGKKKITDETLPLLLNLAELENFNSEGAWLSDDGVRMLAKLPALRGASFFHLSFRKEGFTGAGFEAWKDNPQFERLTVAGMTMGDDGFAAIAKITSLRDLATWHTYQTEKANELIATLPNLTKLNMGQRLPRAGAKAPSFSDASLAVFSNIKTLESLKIGEAKLSLDALRQLKNLPKLKTLTIYETDIAPADIETLRGELPNVKLIFQPLTDEQRKKLENYLKQ